ncbi:MAG: RNA 3'-terminal-phosphate cyclase [Nitrospirae bacterium GWD2_57_9]|nr:MAG: RNA 3'-terminal-phosphate cyclase [Nitrospirae bacterium GWD2_57_9]OGW45407.1 MAG: RNA 3'-terminal-phosphate cyclase [Nitrospirae bacterium GWC2_57_9]
MDGQSLRIDGSYGEGGGQILRTSLALSCLTGTPVEIVNIRQARSRPGLQPQHLTAVRAATVISGAVAEGAAIGSSTLRFEPGPVEGGDYSFDVSEIKGSAGSTSLVLQTILLPLFFAARPSTIILIGGTHVPWSPTFHYLQQVFLPFISRMQVNVDLNLEQWGWYPKGGGRVKAKVVPARELKPLVINDRGGVRRITGLSAVSNLPEDIAHRQRARTVKVLGENDIRAEIEIASGPSIGKGTLLFLLAEFENIKAGFGSLGAIGKRAETVADEASREMIDYLTSEGALDQHLADQIIPYLALAAGRSEFSTTRITRHLLTNIWVVKQFLDVDIQVEGREGEKGKITIR